MEMEDDEDTEAQIQGNMLVSLKGWRWTTGKRGRRSKATFWPQRRRPNVWLYWRRLRRAGVAAGLVLVRRGLKLM